MDVYQASDGSVFNLPRQLGAYESVEAIIADVAAITHIEVGNVLIFLDDGRELKSAILEEAWERGGKGQQSSILYMYNRETFWSDSEQWAVQLQEEVVLPPPIDLSSLTDLSQAQEPFFVAHDHLSHLHSLFQAQSRALQIAYDNLSHHLNPLLAEFQGFAQRAQAEFNKNDVLLRGSEVDLAILPKVVIYEPLTRKKDKDKDKEKDTAGKIVTMDTFISRSKMDAVREGCRESYDDQLGRFNALINTMDSLSLQSEAERRAAEDKAMTVGAEFEGALSRTEAALQQIELLSNESEFSNHLIALDEAMRDDLVSMTSIKNDYTLEIHIHLRQVALFQSRVAELIRPLSTLEADFKSKGGFPHLHRLHQLPFAYLATVVEIIRRKEYAASLVDFTTRLAESLGRYTSQERKRRRQIQEEVLSLMPFKVSGLEESSNPHVEISVSSGGESLSWLAIDRSEVNNLLNWVEDLKSDPDIASAITHGSNDPITELQASLHDLVAQLDSAAVDVEKRVAKSVFLSRSSGDVSASQRMSAQVRAANDEMTENADRILEVEAAHQEQMRQLEVQHQRTISTLQNRQAEMQDEMMRLRTDLSDEMLARQALSAELDVRARTQEEVLRDHEDQSDLVTALQADVAQEKDRATDLGVRLQEALLDVDGLKNAEQTLIAQIQNLQDERSKHIQSLSETRLDMRTLESRLAGAQAELQSIGSQLQTTQKERDQALKNQSAEAERMMRDHIAEADGDRAVLEHQNLTLNKQLDDLNTAMTEKLNAAKNAAIRQADGLRAELSLNKAQLRDFQRKEAVLSDELAMARDTVTAAQKEKAQYSDMARDAISLSGKYNEACARLLHLINSSSTISGSAARQTTPPRGGESLTSSKEENKDGVLGRSLATAQSFDLNGFSEAVIRTIGLVKKWSKSCRQYRESARNRIAFANFTKGDLALFLPTRNAAVRAWAAFNVAAPHHFLKIDQSNQALIGSREWMLARITRVEEGIASTDSPTGNPFGLAEGLRYWVHHVEEYDPSAIRAPRRSTSIGLNGEPSISQMITSTYRGRSDSVDPDGPDALSPGPPEFTPFTPGSKAPIGSYFPAMTAVVPVAVPVAMPLESSVSASIATVVPGKGGPDQPPLASEPESVLPADPPATDTVSASPSVTLRQPNNSPTASLVTAPLPQSQEPQSVFPISTVTGPLPLPLPVPVPVPVPAPPRHQRNPSSGISPTPIFAPSSQGRPASVASSNSASHNHHYPGIGVSTKAAPSMSLTTSHDSADGSPRRFSQQHILTKRPSIASLTQGQSLSPVFAEPSASTNPAPAAGGTGVAAVARSISRGFSIGTLGRTRTPSALGTSPPVGAGPGGKDGKASAMDILKRF